MRSDQPRTPLAMCIQTAVESYATSLCGSQPRKSAANGTGTSATISSGTPAMSSGTAVIAAAIGITRMFTM